MTSTDSKDPNDIAQSLVRELGHANAYLEAAREGYLAQNEGRFYELSVWREVKAILRETRGAGQEQASWRQEPRP